MRHFRVSWLIGALITGVAWLGHGPATLAATVEVHHRIVTRYAYYPTPGVMQVEVNLGGLATVTRQQVQAVRLQVRKLKTGQVVASTTMPPPHDAVTRLPVWKLPPLDGRYQLVVRLVGTHIQPQVYSFVRYHFPWEHNQLGKADIVVPPFTPLKVQGDTVQTILRRTTMNDVGLWRQVQAKGKNLLAGPMRIVVRAGGQRYVGQGQMKFEQIAPTRVVAVARWYAGPLNGTTRSVWDYDGMMKTTLCLEPTKEKIDAVTMVIPLVNKRMPLLHACTNLLRDNYAGRTPAGQGVIWNGSQAKNIFITGSYEPYIWVGGPLRGMAVFGDNDRGWVDYQAKTPCQELVRKANDTLELRLNLVAKPARIKKTRQIVLGFQATPIKPMPKNWRLWTFVNPTVGGYNLAFAGSCYAWGGLTASDDLYPRGQDFSIWREFARTRRTGKIPAGFINHWLAGYRAPNPLAARYYGIGIRSTFQQLAAHRQGIIVYTNVKGMRLDTREGQTYLDEWDRQLFPARQYAHGACLDYDVDTHRSFRDFALWYYDKMLTTFVDGIYWDDVLFEPDFNTLLTDAYRLPNGNIQPVVMLWSARALIRRTAVLDTQLGKRNINMCHMTAVAIAPVLAFARMDFDWEQKAGDAPFQDRFSRSFILTESIGRQFGNVPAVLSLVRGSDQKKLAWARRTQAGICLTYEIREMAQPSGGYHENFARLVKFGYGTPSVKVWNYWRHGYPMKITGDKTSSIVLSKPGQVLIVVCDWGHGGMLHLQPDLARLHLSGPLTAVNMETQKPVPVSPAGGIALHLKKYAYEVLLVKMTRRISPDR